MNQDIINQPSAKTTDSLRVWLVTIGEPLPIDSSNERLYRIGILADKLIKRGHEVIWWSSTLDHIKKRHRHSKDHSISLSPKYHLKLLHSLIYKKNISLIRVINHYGVAKKFAKLSKYEPTPDIIISSVPPLELSLAAVKYGKKRGVPVILDARDMWPDIFVDIVPKWGRWLFKMALYPMFRIAKSAFKGASAIIGITPDFVNWGINYAERVRTNIDCDFPLGYQDKIPNTEAIKQAEDFWDGLGINNFDKNEFTICYFGTIGPWFEFDTIIKAVDKLNALKLSFNFVLCGDGDYLNQYQEIAKNYPNIIFPGWVGEAQIWTLMRRSKVGLLPYRSTKDFQVSIPNKIPEYLSAGLPVISSLQGISNEIITVHDCGITYENGDPESLASVLENLYYNPNKLKTLSKNAYKLFQGKFVAEKVYGQLIDYLESIVVNYKK